MKPNTGMEKNLQGILLAVGIGLMVASNMELTESEAKAFWLVYAD